MFDNPLLVLLAASFVFGGPLGWLAWHRGYRRRAAWVWVTIPLGVGVLMGLWAAISTRDPLVPWRCPACGALTRPSEARTIEASTGLTLLPSGPGVTAMVAGGILGSTALVVVAVALTGGEGALPWLSAAGLALIAAITIVWGHRRAGLHDTSRLLTIGYSCRACGQRWHVETDPDEGPNQAGARVTGDMAFDDSRVTEELARFVAASTPYDVSDHLARWDAVRAITRIGGTRAVDALIVLLDDESCLDAAAGGLAELGSPRAVQPLGRALAAAAVAARSSDPIAAARATRHCIAAAEALGAIGDGRSARALDAIADDLANPRAVRQAARRARDRLHRLEAA